MAQKQKLQPFDNLLDRLGPFFSEIIEKYFSCFNYSVKFHLETTECLSNVHSDVLQMRLKVSEARDWLVVQSISLTSLRDKSEMCTQLLILSNKMYSNN